MPDLLSSLAAALSERYALQRELGRGAAATVYLAHDLKHKRQVAIKVLAPELALAVRTERFLREIEIAAQLSHPHIVPLYDSGEVAGFLYYVMPYVEGESLRERLTGEGPLPVEDALRITREVAEALDYAHQRGVIHRDIKPGNILLQAGHAVVADFGIARALSAAADEEDITGTGVSLGTPAYMSPEQARGEPVDRRTDVWAFGCVVYEMLTGRPAFRGETVTDTLAAVLKSEPDWNALTPALPPEVRRMSARSSM